MGDGSSIEWTDATWNPTTGCDRVSDGCANCYALNLARRLKAMGNPRYQVDGNAKSSGPGFGLSLHHDVLALPLSWRRPRFVFVNSMSDLSVGVSAPGDAPAQALVLVRRPPRRHMRPRRLSRTRLLLSLPLTAAAATVHLRHQSAVSLSCRRQLLVTFLQGAPQVEDLLLEVRGLGFEGGGVLRCAESASLERLGSEEIGQPVLQGADVLGKSTGLVSEVGIVGQQ